MEREQLRSMEPVTDLYLFLLSTVFISLTGVMSPGPVFAVTVTKGYKDRKAGALIAFGHGVIEFPLMTLIYLGFASFFAFSQTKIAIGLIGGLMLVYMGLEMFKARRRTEDKEDKDVGHGSFAAGIVTTIANPYFFLWWATIGLALIRNASDFGTWGFLFFAVVHWLCDFLWDLFVSFSVFKSRHLWSWRTREVVFGLCSVLLIGFGAWFIFSVWV